MDKKDLQVSNQPSRGGDKETKTEVVAKDYGRKPYLSKTYSEMMGRVPTRAILDQVLQKKSQFEKPYIAEEDYEEMQHWVPRFSPFNWGDWEDTGPVSFPNLRLPPANPFKTPEGRGWLCELGCTGWGGFCNGDECDDSIGTCYAGLGRIGSIGSWSVTGSPIEKILTGIDNPAFKKARFRSLDSIEIYPDWDSIEVSSTSLWGHYRWKKATFQITYTDEDGNVCKGEITVSCCSTCECPSDPAFAYDSGNPTTIARETDVTITVDNGCGDYSWAVSGTGFSFVNSTTTEGSNLLSADNTACGVATITVTDYCGIQVTGVVKCTTGQWYRCVPHWSPAGTHGPCGLGYFEYYVDQYYVYGECSTGGVYGTGPFCVDCSLGGGSSNYCISCGGGENCYLNRLSIYIWVC